MIIAVIITRTIEKLYRKIIKKSLVSSNEIEFNFNSALLLINRYRIASTVLGKIFKYIDSVHNQLN